jgi:lysophospholipase L1-like esterase
MYDEESACLEVLVRLWKLGTVALAAAIAAPLGLAGPAAASAASAASAAPAAALAAPAAAPAACQTVTVFVAGDSTAAVWPASTQPKAGWGQALAPFLDPRRVQVDDEALSGASSRSFVELGLLDKILAAIRPGDYLIISFGHNDEKTDDRHTDPFTTFQQYLSMYIDGALAHGAHPVLATPVERRRFDANGHATPSHGDYPEAMRELGAARDIPVVDLTTLSMALWDQLGPDGTKGYFLWLDPGVSPNWPDGVADNTHFQAHGAIALARIVISAMVAQHILPRPLAIRLNRPVPDDSLYWPPDVPAAAAAVSHN